MPDTVVQAKMEAVKPVYLAGTVEGDVCCKSLLVIDPGGRVQGDVLCESLVLEGRIEGNVEAGHAVLAAGAVAAVVILHFVRKKQGKGGCGCDCAHCGGCCHLHKKEEKE